MDQVLPGVSVVGADGEPVLVRTGSCWFQRPSRGKCAGRGRFMRLLHTSDWHLGRAFHRVNMLGAQAEFIDHLVATVRERDVDAVLVAGDVYDRAVPAAGRGRALRRRPAPARRARRAHGHDLREPRLGPPARRRRRASSTGRASICGPTRRLRHPGGACRRPRRRRLLRAAVSRTRPGEGRVRGGEGRATRRCSPPPWTGSGPTWPPARQAPAPSSWPTPSSPAAQASDSERDITVGGVAAVPAGVFDGVDYVALGHLHGCQTITERVRYSGSPLPTPSPRPTTARPCGWSTSAPTARSTPSGSTAPCRAPLARIRGRAGRPARRPGARPPRGGLGRGHPHRPGPARRAHGPALRTLPAHAQPRLRPRARRRTTRTSPTPSGSPGRSDQQIAEDFVAHVRGGTGPDEHERTVLQGRVRRRTGRRRPCARWPR